ncbi:branched-chain amino acid aminotransferase 2, chloroplastic-like isoform X3 [Telopea speciosissima]|uniref:branched-chain amino acid aminotransferase 2, chloroplastic-like isoform X3 n=1 Tax=Telopea speciosissima TaxID=54955 RepID=UPI001CC59750|nr:branched-chain amino acid aminotransferase 2, chloroplastic-like isoform X3 [Telopea speciosissima]
MESGLAYAGAAQPNHLLSPSRNLMRLLSPASFRDRREFPSSSFLKLQNQLPFKSSLQTTFSTHREAAVLSDPSSETFELADINWDDLGFGHVATDYMYVSKCPKGGNFSGGELVRFGNIELSPSSGVLNYGQGLFEGLKAYRKQDGSILLFRPEENALRMWMGADRMCMESPSIEQFVEAIKLTVLANKRWVPPAGKGSLYIRPLLLGSGAVLGLAPAPEYTFLIFVSPVGNYFKEGLAPIHLIVENEFHRATPGGTGGVKTIGNYAADSVISTPAIKGTILPGITRKSIIDVALSQGFKVEERLVSVEELLDADEVFCTGTAVVVSPVGSITYLDKRVSYGDRKVGAVSQQLYTALTSLQVGLSEDKMGWTVELK